MVKTKQIKTSKDEIVSYWGSSLVENGILDPKDNGAQVCWRCGVKKRLDRCHIIAESRGGLDTPLNYVLLCKHCHIASPDVDCEDIMWWWLKAYSLKEEGPFWFEQGIREYEFIFSRNWNEDLSLVNYSRESFFEAMSNNLSRGIRHFGQPSHNPSTVAGIIYLTFEEIKKETNQ